DDDDDAADDDDDSAADDDDSAADDDDSAGTTCDGDALVSDVPLSTDLAAFESRWVANEELTRILFIGEPF
ncbi:MAG: hypothetical protein KDA24_25190, partial [Deltaproteobacteria bacterium]|nr:hypothetical protein [Deltaproteobacteria bacterium]